jgi:Protein of unknown function (DUF2442)
MLIRAQSVQPLTDFLVRLVFTDGTTRDQDLAPYRQGPIFQPIRRDAEPFRAVHVDADRRGALTWPGDVDIHQDVLCHGTPPPWAIQLDQPKAPESWPRDMNSPKNKVGIGSQ